MVLPEWCLKVLLLYLGGRIGKGEVRLSAKGPFRRPGGEAAAAPES